MRKKTTIQAGRMVRQILCSSCVGCHDERTRAGRVRETSEAQKRINYKLSYQKLADILATNFPRGSDVVTLTYDDAHYPKDNKRVEADLKQLRKRLTKVWEKHGRTFRMAWAIEHKHGDGRWHVHAVLSACTGSGDIPLILTAWGRGRIDLHHLDDSKDRNHLTLAHYMAKESEDRENSKHSWHYTRNCVQPYRRSESCIDMVLHAPKGAQILDEGHWKNEFGSFAYIIYYVPEDAPERTQKTLKKQPGIFI